MSGRRDGIVLISVLVVVVLLTLAAYQFSELMMAEYRAAASYSQGLQTRALANSGVAYVAANLSDANALSSVLGGNPFDNAAAFQNVTVPGDPDATRQGRFTIISLRYPDDPNFMASPYRFGVTDEAGKINLNALLQLDSTGNVGVQMLMTLPNMTQDIANSILDWLDPDDDPRSNGAENEYYATLNPPYQCKNGPLDSLEELLLVKGVTPQLLFGNDRNRNGTLDDGEDDGTGQVDLGWSAYLTVYSREPNIDSTGAARIYVNDPDPNNLRTNMTNAGIDTTMANFILAYRVFGGTTGGGMGTMASSYKAPSGADATAVSTALENALAAGSQRLTPISSLYDLLTAKVNVTTGMGNMQRSVSMPSPLSDPGQQASLLPVILDKLTTSKASDLPARINVNTASQTVLSALPGLQQADVQAILDHRPDPTAIEPPDPIFQSTAWLLTEANLSPTTLKALDAYITARSSVYRFQAIGYFSDNRGGFSRVEAVVDTNYGRPRIVYYRPLDMLGKGFDLTVLNNSN